MGEALSLQSMTGLIAWLLVTGLEVDRHSLCIHKQKIEEENRSQFPLGLPGYHDMLYPLEDTMDWVLDSKLRR
jgi:hypothetical protein